jgi:hypothetical protein
MHRNFIEVKKSRRWVVGNLCQAVDDGRNLSVVNKVDSFSRWPSVTNEGQPIAIESEPAKRIESVRCPFYGASKVDEWSDGASVRSIDAPLTDAIDGWASARKGDGSVTNDRPGQLLKSSSSAWDLHVGIGNLGDKELLSVKKGSAQNSREHGK